MRIGSFDFFGAAFFYAIASKAMLLTHKRRKGRRSIASNLEFNCSASFSGQQSAVMHLSGVLRYRRRELAVTATDGDQTWLRPLAETIRFTV